MYTQPSPLMWPSLSSFAFCFDIIYNSISNTRKVLELLNFATWKVPSLVSPLCFETEHAHGLACPDWRKCCQQAERWQRQLWRRMAVIQPQLRVGGHGGPHAGASMAPILCFSAGLKRQGGCKHTYCWRHCLSATWRPGSNWTINCKTR